MSSVILCLNVNSPATFSVQICIFRSFSAFQFNFPREMLQEENPNLTQHLNINSAIHIVLWEQREQSKPEKSKEWFTICLLAFTLRKEAVPMKLRGPKPPANMHDPMSEQHSHSASALQPSGAARGAAWQRSRATNGTHFRAQQEWQHI